MGEVSWEGVGGGVGGGSWSARFYCGAVDYYFEVDYVVLGVGAGGSSGVGEGYGVVVGLVVWGDVDHADGGFGSFAAGVDVVGDVVFPVLNYEVALGGVGVVWDVEYLVFGHGVYGAGDGDLFAGGLRGAFGG